MLQHVRPLSAHLANRDEEAAAVTEVEDAERPVHVLIGHKEHGGLVPYHFHLLSRCTLIIT